MTLVDVILKNGQIRRGNLVETAPGDVTLDICDEDVVLVIAVEQIHRIDFVDVE
jgi:hypothetical protein